MRPRERIEFLEYLASGVLGDARPLIAHRHIDAATAPEQRERDDAVARREVDRVVLAQIDRRGLVQRAARFERCQLHHAVHQFLDALRIACDVGDEARALRLGHVLLQQLGRTADCRQRSLDLVRQRLHVVGDVVAAGERIASRRRPHRSRPAWAGLRRARSRCRDGCGSARAAAQSASSWRATSSRGHRRCGPGSRSRRPTPVRAGHRAQRHDRARSQCLQQAELVAREFERPAVEADLAPAVVDAHRRDRNGTSRCSVSAMPDSSPTIKMRGFIPSAENLRSTGSARRCRS